MERVDTDVSPSTLPQSHCQFVDLVFMWFQMSEAATTNLLKTRLFPLLLHPMAPPEDVDRLSVRVENGRAPLKQAALRPNFHISSLNACNMTHVHPGSPRQYFRTRAFACLSLGNRYGYFHQT